MSAMQDFGADYLNAFAEKYKSELSDISKYSKGEWRASDVLQEACLLILELGAERGYPFDPDCEADGALVLRVLRRSVRSSAEVVRHAFAYRLDQAAPGDEERGHHWLMDKLVADEGEHPQSLLEAVETAASQPEAPEVEPYLDPYHTPYAGWARLRQLYGRTANIADYLLISVSWCRVCRRNAKHQAETQWPLPHQLSVGDRAEAIQPWRKFKLISNRPSPPDQLAFEYWNKPSQPVSGQLWLL